MNIADMTIISNFVIYGLLVVLGCGGSYAYYRYRKKELSNPFKKKKDVVDTIPVKIIKTRGDSVLIEKKKGKITKLDKESEVMSLKIDRNRTLDMLDFTKINSDGELVLIEKSDGQLVYADIDKDKVTTSGEGLLRDGYYLNQAFIDTAFPIQENKWKMWIPIILVMLAIIGIAISTYFTYDYFKALDESRAESERVNAQIIENAMSSLEKIVRSVEISVESQKEISNHYRDIVKELKQISSGG